MEFEQFLYDEFIAEANEHLHSIEEDFLALEAQADNPDHELVDKVFRAIHSVKGGSAFLGLTSINRLAHAMESVLDKVRDGEMRPDSACVGALLDGLDLLNEMVADPLASNEVDIESVRAKVEAVLTGEAPPTPAPSAQPAPPAAAEPEPEPEPEAPAAPVLPESAMDLASLDFKALLSEHDFCYLLRYDLMDQGSDPADVFAELGDSGHVADCALVTEEGGLRMEVAYATLFDPDMVQAVTGLDEDAVHLLAELNGPLPGAAASEPEAEPESEPEAEVEATQSEVRPAPPAPPTPPTPIAPAKSVPGPAGGAGSGGPAQGDAARAQGTVRINVGLLDKLMTLAGELVLVRNQQLISAERIDSAQRDVIQRLDIVTTELQSTIMRTRMQPIGNVLGKLPRIVRDLAKRLDKQINLDISGSEVELDKTILESLADPLTHLIRNCCDHGIETPAERERAGKPPVGRIRVRAFHEGGQINIELKDDGAGIRTDLVRRKVLENGLKSEADLAQMSEKEILSMIMMPGFSTATQVSDVSGRGVGMDVVKHCLEELGGSVDLDSWPGKGTSFQLRLPLTLAIIPCLIVQVDDCRYAIPQVNLEELVTLYDDEAFTRIEVAGNQEVYRLRDRLLPMVRLREVLARPAPFHRDDKAEVARTHQERNEKGLEEWRESVRARDEAADAAAESLDEEAVQALEAMQESLYDVSLHFAVVKVGQNRFGIIVDKVLGTEEIVVKPMHGSLKHLKCYSGATVMGDGAVSLILDIEGIARHAGVSLEQLSEEITAASIMASSKYDTQSILLFKSGPEERFAVALPLIRRIERIERSQIERVGDKEFVTLDGESVLILRLEKHMTVSPCTERDELFLILPKFIRSSFGILMSGIVDILETSVHLNTESYMEDGLLGTDVIGGHLTLFPDIYRLAEMAEPLWFAERREIAPPPEEPAKVLLVEDSGFLRQMVRKYLESDQYDVVDVEHGKEALAVMQDMDFDLIVSDIEMPVMNGLEFIKNVRLTARQKDIPSMALTSLSSDEDRYKALEAGFDEYQVKIDRERFLEQAARLLTSRMQGGRHV